MKMEIRQYRTYDRSAWPHGEWDNEPDKVQWPDPETGLPCLAVRNHHFGNWCGYVGVAEGHPYYGKSYDEVDVEVHGGVTFAGPCDPDADEAESICHVPGAGESDRVHWLGFDCAHAFDLAPLMQMHFRMSDNVYRTLEYVQIECAKLAEQLARVGQP